MLSIVDYGASNLRSVVNAFQSIGEKPAIVDTPEGVRNAHALVLPGVGAFGDGIDKLNEQGLLPVLHEAVLEHKKPYLGICLGMQFVAKRSVEHGSHDGFGWLDAEVLRIEPPSAEYRIPHMGWNELELRGPSPLFNGLASGSCFYFVHSFAMQCRNGSGSAVIATCDYGNDIVAAIQKDNIFGVQFHPEKSQQNGLKLLENFISYCKEC